jgi:hypothetical protein
MDEKILKTGFRNAWILTVVAAIFIIGFFAFTLKMNTPPHQVKWNMGGTAFVPASAPAATGYYVPPAKKAAGAPAPKEAK